jgi:hypothetical protein
MMQIDAAHAAVRKPHITHPSGKMDQPEGVGNSICHVIPGCAVRQASDVQLQIGESILTMVVMDSGFALKRAPE